jgi:hypothetical protein
MKTSEVSSVQYYETPLYQEVLFVEWYGEYIYW